MPFNRVSPVNSDRPGSNCNIFFLQCILEKYLDQDTKNTPEMPLGEISKIYINPIWPPYFQKADFRRGFLFQSLV